MSMKPTLHGSLKNLAAAGATASTAAVSVFSAIFCVAALAAAPAHALDLTVEITGARSAQGTVSVALYSTSEGWLKQTVAAQRVGAGDRVSFVFRDLSPGTYAFAAFHDENGNGKLDTNVVGIPTEPYGFSRDARGSFGPPKFDAAAIELNANLTVKAALQ